MASRDSEFCPRQTGFAGEAHALTNRQMPAALNNAVRSGPPPLQQCDQETLMSDTQVTERIAWIGLGRMGAAMATRLLDSAFDLAVWNRTATYA